MQLANVSTFSMLSRGYSRKAFIFAKLSAKQDLPGELLENTKTGVNALRLRNVSDAPVKLQAVHHNGQRAAMLSTSGLVGGVS